MNLPYKEGMVFAVPLRDGSGFALGVVARVSPDDSGAVLAYFFGPRHKTLPPASSILSGLRAKDARRVLRFGDPLLRSGQWPIVGTLEEWDRTEWPIPPFVYKDDVNQKAWCVRYSDESVTSPVAEEPVPYETEYESDVAYGASSIELLLTRSLA